MSEPLNMAVVEGRSAGGKFAKGHSFGGYAAKINRLSKRLRFRLIRCADRGGDVDRLYRQLLKDAENATEGSVRVAAARTLLGYILGKPDQTLNVEHHRPPVISLDAIAAALDELGVPRERQPIEVQQYREATAKKVESRVIEGPKEET